jgi:hypothetical protein
MLFEHTPTATKSLATSAPLESSPRSGAFTDAELDASIRRISETRVAVARSFVDRVLRSPAELMRLARVVHHEENAQVIGVQLLRCAQPLAC